MLLCRLHTWRGHDYWDSVSTVAMSPEGSRKGDKGSESTHVFMAEFVMKSVGFVLLTSTAVV